MLVKFNEREGTMLPSKGVISASAAIVAEAPLAAERESQPGRSDVRARERYTRSNEVVFANLVTAQGLLDSFVSSKVNGMCRTWPGINTFRA